MRIKALFSLAALGFASLAFAQAQTTVIEEKKSETVTVVVKETPKPPAFVFELHGFVSTTGYFQDSSFNSPGQNALFQTAQWQQDKPLFGFDIRQTRLNFSVRGPAVLGGAVPKAVVEFDMFGSSEVTPPASGAFGDVSILPRVRTAYVELNWDEGRHILQIGQQNMLTIGVIPQSLSHIAFPATYTAGTVGWRQPGFWGWHTFGDDLKWEFAWSIQRSGWANNDLVGGINAGVASGLPAFEARLKASVGKVFSGWISGHWQTVDRNGANVIAVPNSNNDFQTVLGTVGVNGSIGPVAYSGSAWYGKNTGPLLGNILQFSPVLPGPYSVDIFGYGVWGQVGMNLTKNISGWFTYGIDHPVYENIIQINQSGPAGAAVTRLRNQNLVVMARYQDGGFAFGAEWLYTRTTDLRFNDPLTGSQISITGNYYF